MNAKLKILLVNDFKKAGGAEKVFADSADLLKQKADVTTFWASETYSRSGSVKDYIFSKYYLKRIFDLLIDLRPDIIHFHGYYHVMSPSVLAAVKKYRSLGHTIKVFYTAHDCHLIAPNSSLIWYSRWNNSPHVLEGAPGSLLILLKKWDQRGAIYSLAKKVQWIWSYWFKRLQREIDVVVSPSQTISTLIGGQYPFIQSYLLRNPVDLPDIPPHPVATLNQDEAVKLLFVGRLSQEKDLLRFIQTMEPLRGLSFDIIGDGPEEGRLRKHIQEHRLDDRVTLLGRVPHQELFRKFASYHALVLCSLNETAPLTLAEAAMGGLRLLTLDKFGMKEISEICGGAYFFRNGDIDSLEKAVGSIRSDIQSGKSVRRDIDAIKKTFDSKAHLKHLMEYYQDALRLNR